MFIKSWQKKPDDGSYLGRSTFMMNFNKLAAAALQNDDREFQVNNAKVSLKGD